jgi:hypothetical protein
MGIQDEMFEAVKCRYDDLVELNKATVAENEKLRALLSRAMVALTPTSPLSPMAHNKLMSNIDKALKGEDDG